MKIKHAEKNQKALAELSDWKLSSWETWVQLLRRLANQQTKAK